MAFARELLLQWLPHAERNPQHEKDSAESLEECDG